MMWALTSPTFSVSRSLISLSPAMIASRASRTQSGQRESVSRGHPRTGLLFCQDFSSGLSDHLGMNEGFILYLLNTLIPSKVAPATAERVASKYFSKRVSTRLGMERTPSDLTSPCYRLGVAK